MLCLAAAELLVSAWLHALPAPSLQFVILPRAVALGPCPFVV